MEKLLIMLLALPLFAQPVQQVESPAPMIGLKCFEGHFTAGMQQHPMKAPRNQSYFVKKTDQKHSGEWIADLSKTDFKNLKLKTAAKVCGEIKIVDLGGKPGTRGSYKNKMLVVETIQYMKQKPIKKTAPKKLQK